MWSILKKVAIEVAKLVLKALDNLLETKQITDNTSRMPDSDDDS